jgi:hypothetical protein
MVVAIIYGWLILQFLHSGWLGRSENSTGVQAVAAAAQAIFAVALIVLTIRTVQANAKLVDETERMAEVAVQQQQAAIRPVLAFRIYPFEGRKKPDAKEFMIEVFNVGAGAALDTRIFVVGPLRYVESSEFVQPLAIAPLESATFSYALDDDVPFVDPTDPLCWPPDDVAELEREDEELESRKVWRNRGSQEAERLAAIRKEVKVRSNQHVGQLVARIGERRDIGQMRAEYSDLGGAAHVSSADLRVVGTGPVKTDEAAPGDPDEMDLWAFNPYWPDVSLGPLSVTGPVIRNGQREGATEAAP